MSDIENTSEAYAHFDSWLNEQPYWVQDAAWRIYNGKKIDDEQIKLYSEMCIAQTKGDTPNYNRITTSEIMNKKNSSSISILSLSEIKGVNALSDKANLNFAENGITAIYGLNGAGKSGFMRIFKELSGCPYEEPIQPNIYEKNNPIIPSCKIVISNEGEQKEEVYNLANKNRSSSLSVCDVFDTRISNAYITTTNNVSYQPFVFTVLSEIAQIASKITRYIDNLMVSVSEKSLEPPDNLISSTHIKWIENISKDTVIPPDYLAWAPENEDDISKLLKLLDNEKVEQQLVINERSKANLESVLDDLQNALALYNKDTFAKAYNDLISKKKLFETAKLLFSDNADKEDRLSIDSSDWKTLWDSAKKYYEEIVFKSSGIHFGEEGSICPLCHQTISQDVQKRFSSIDHYINGIFSSEYQTAQKTFKKLCDDLKDRNQNSLTVNISLSGIFRDDELLKVLSVYDAFETIKKTKDCQQIYTVVSNIDIANAVEIISNRIKSFNLEIVSLKDAQKDDAKIRLEDQLEYLRFKKWVFDKKDIINRVITNLQYIFELENTKKYLSTNKITSESNKLADFLITQAYIKRFTKELSQMAPKIKVKLEKAQSHKGNSPYKVSIDTDSGKKCKPEDILSEGEQRIVSLAAFFADATGREELTPIIIDDPISSLDLNYEDNATRRIVDLAKQRQVIVFTHRISMLQGISDTCENTGVTIKRIYIRSTDKGKGMPDFTDVYHGKLADQFSGLKNRLTEVKKMDKDSEEYEICIKNICQQFRICVERSVEDVLLLGIVRRFNKDIKTKNLIMKLSTIDESDCKIVDDMMTKYSYIEHSQPADAYIVKYSAEEIDDDITMFAKWCKDYKKKHNK